MLKLILAGACAATLAAAPGYAAETMNWSFSGTHDGNGTLTYDADDQLTAFTGQYNGQSLSLVNRYGDPNNSSAELSFDTATGLTTYRGVPNTGGANYTFDNKAHQTPDTYNFLVSTGMGSNEIVYSLGYDRPNNFFFFNIVTDPYQYVQDNGTFTLSASATPAVPEPASWAMMVIGIGAAGYAMRRRQKNAVTVSFAA